jgi:hypothetical protein
MAKRKMRKFAAGGFTREQEEWLGGADRTDPYILARMRDAHPDNVYKDNAPYKSDDQGFKLTKEMVESERSKNGYADTPVTKTVTKSKVAVTKPKSTWEDDSKIPAMPDTPKKSKSSWDDDSNPQFREPHRCCDGVARTLF